MRKKHDNNKNSNNYDSFGDNDINIHNNSNITLIYNNVRGNNNHDNTNNNDSNINYYEIRITTLIKYSESINFDLYFDKRRTEKPKDCQQCWLLQPNLFLLREQELVLI